MRRRVIVGLVASVVLGGGAFAVVGGASPWLLSQSAATVVLRPDDTAITALGREIYAAQCAVCHGAELEGEPNWRQRRANGRLPAPPHDETGHTWHHPDAQLFALTRYGVEPFAPPGYESDMPAYDGILTDDEIIAVLSYIKSTWPDEIRRRHDRINASNR